MWCAAFVRRAARGVGRGVDATLKEAHALRVRRIVVVAACVACACSRSPSKVSDRASDAAPATNDARAREAVDLMLKGSFAEVAARFNDKMRGALPVEELGRVWRTLVGQVGPFQEITGSRSEAKGTY